MSPRGAPDLGRHAAGRTAHHHVLHRQDSQVSTPTTSTTSSQTPHPPSGMWWREGKAFITTVCSLDQGLRERDCIDLRVNIIRGLSSYEKEGSPFKSSLLKRPLNEREKGWSDIYPECVCVCVHVHRACMAVCGHLSDSQQRRSLAHHLNCLSSD